MLTGSSQPSIMKPVPSHARVIEFKVKAEATLADILSLLKSLQCVSDIVIGLGPDLLDKFSKTIDGFHGFKNYQGINCTIPSTQASLALRISNTDCGKIAKKSREFIASLSQSFTVERSQNVFMYLDGHDLTGYEDGTENPEGEEAENAALMSDDNPCLNGSSIFTIQRWDHDIASFQKRPQEEQDHIIGRRLSDNGELDDAPEYAHVKRTAQESFEPEAFILRRSMPWSDEKGEGLLFMCFTRHLYAFEAQLERMIGLEDKIVDGLFKFSTPVTGAHYWCPPITDNKLNLSFLD